MINSIRSSRITETYLDTIRSSSNRVDKLLSALNSQKIVLGKKYKGHKELRSEYFQYYNQGKATKELTNSSPESTMETPKYVFKKNSRSLERFPRCRSTNLIDKSIQTNLKNNNSSYDKIPLQHPVIRMKIRESKQRDHLKPKNQFEYMMDYYKNRVKLHFMPKKHMNTRISDKNCSLENIKCIKLFD